MTNKRREQPLRREAARWLWQDEKTDEERRKTNEISYWDKTSTIEKTALLSLVRWSNKKETEKGWKDRCERLQRSWLKHTFTFGACETYDFQARIERFCELWLVPFRWYEFSELGFAWLTRKVEFRIAKVEIRHIHWAHNLSRYSRPREECSEDCKSSDKRSEEIRWVKIIRL